MKFTSYIVLCKNLLAKVIEVCVIQKNTSQELYVEGICV